MRSRPFTLVVAIVVVLTLVLYLIGFQVAQNEVAVLFRFGQPVKPITAPGLYWKWPSPIQSVKKYDKRLNVFQSKYTQGLTRDGKNIIVESATVWRISDPLVFFTSVGSEEEYENKQVAIVRSFQSGLLGQRDLSELINVDNKKIKLGEIESEVKRQSAEATLKQFGVEVVDYRIERLVFPESTTKDVFERMKAERTTVIDRIKAEGDGQAKAIKAEADSKRTQALAKANAEAKKIKAEGDAKAAESYVVFKKNPELAKFLFELDALESILKERSTVILDTSKPPFDVLSPAGAKGSGK